MDHMDPTPFDLSVVVLGEETLVAVAGELDFAAVEVLDAALADCSGPLTVDLGGITFCDVAGFRALERAALRGAAVDLHSESANPRVRWLAQLLDQRRRLIDD